MIEFKRRALTTTTSVKLILILLLCWMSQASAVDAPLEISITNPPAAVTANSAGDTQFWAQAGNLNDGGVLTPISLRATVQSISAGDTISFFTSGDNPVVRANTGTLAATVLWEVFDRNTGLPIAGSPDFLITDIDGRNGNPIESVSAACAGLTSFTTNGEFIAGCNANANNTGNAMCMDSKTNIRVSESGGSILAEGTQNQNGNQQESYMQYSWTDLSNWTVSYFATTGGRWYVHDADGDIPFDGTRVDIELVDLATIKGLTASSLTSPAQNEFITFKIDLSNAGPENATNVSLTDLLPAGLAYDSHTVTSGNYVPGTGVWSGVGIVVGDIETITITAQVTAVAGTTITNVTTTALAAESICSSRDLLEYSFVVAETPAPSLSIVKTISSVTSFEGAGDSITYSYNVTNTGNVNINGVTPQDAGPTFGGMPATNALSVFSPANATLIPGQSQIFTATYLLDQVDVDNMASDAAPLTAIDNTATATGVPTGGMLAAVTPSMVETGFAPMPNLTVAKSVTGATTFNKAGDQITYQYVVNNNGNITIDSVVPVDAGPTFGGIAATNSLSAFSPLSASIEPMGSETFTATYTLDLADVNNMAAAANPLVAISNTTTVTGDPVGNTALPVVPNSIANTGFAPMPSLTIAKSVGAATSFSKAGDTITYEYVIENTGNVTVNNVVPTDTGPTFNSAVASNSLSAFSPLSASIAPQTNQLFTATYVLSQLDVDNMAAAADPVTAISNTASAQGNPAGGTLPAVTPNSVMTGFAPVMGLTLSKVAGTPSVGLGSNTAATDAGDTIAYSFEVTNTSVVTLDSLVINDLGVTFNSIAGTGTLSVITCPVVTFNPNQTTACSATYTLSQVDVDNAILGGANSVANTANAVTESPNNSSVNSANASATTSIVAASSIELSKSASAPTISLGADASIVDPNDTITYSVLVENTGNASLSNVSVSDSIVTLTCPSTTAQSNAFANDGTDTLAVGDSIICTAVYPLLQTDLDAGGVTNVATVTANDPANTVVNDSDTVTSGFTQKAAIALVKSGTPLPASPVAGDLITYDFELTNTGNVTLASPQIVDTMCQIPGSTLTLASGYQSGDTLNDGEMNAGEVWLFQCQYAITQPDINTGEITNTATGSGTPPAGSGLAVPMSSASNLAEAQQNAAISMVKTASLPTIANGSLSSQTDVGDTISYTFEVENTGNVTLSNVLVTDPFITGAPNNGVISCPAGVASMAPGAVLICTASYTLQLSEINAGQVSNTASATGTPPLTVPPTDAPVSESSAVVNITPAPALSIVKTVDALPIPFAENSIITYNYSITNDGNVTISAVMPVDSGPTFNGIAGTNSLSSFSPLTVSLDPGLSQIFTATYSVSQTDVDNLSSAMNPLTAIDNSATASGNPAQGALPSVTPSLAETGVALVPSFELSKTSTAPALPVVGAEIMYDFSLDNTGPLSISNPTISDAKCATPGATLSFASGYLSGDTGIQAGVLEPTETWLFQCRYPLTQADIDAGTVQNTATAAGQAPSGATVQDTSDTANAGDGGAANNDPTNTPLLQTPMWGVIKTTSSTPTNAGDTLVYDFELDNSGNVSISNVMITDANCATAIALVSGDTNLDSILDPNETWVYRCTSIGVTQTQVNTGVVSNTVNVVGMPPTGSPALLPASDTVDTNITPAPSLSVVKTASAPTVGFGLQSMAIDPDDQIAYSFEVTNTGNVTLNSLSINDSGPTFNSAAGGGALSAITCLTTTLNPTQSTACTATYTLVQADIDAGIAGGANAVENSAIAQGTPPVGAVVTSTPSAAMQSIVANPELEVTKIAGSPTIAGGLDPLLTDPNDTIPFTISVSNTGNTTLSNVNVSDDLATVTCNAMATPSNGTFTNGTGNLAVGDTIECQATYSVIQDNINVGFVVNTATVTAQDPAGNMLSGVDEATSTFTQKTSLSLQKTSNTLPVSPVAGVSTLTYTFNLTNTGNVSLTGAQVADAKCLSPATPLNFSNGYTSGDDGNGILDASETWVLNCDYTITQQDIDDGEVSNVATATGTPPVSSGLDDPSATASNLAEAAQNTGISLDKVSGTPTQNNGSNSQVGDTITYTFTIQNLGNVTLTDMVITDPLITAAPNNGAISCVRDDVGATAFDLTADSMAPTDIIICSGVYTLQQTDIDAGTVANAAEVSGTPPMSVPPIDNPVAMSGSTAPIPPNPTLSIVKTASPIASTVVAGDSITYMYVIQNTGNVTISNATPVDLGPTINGFAGTNALSAYSPAFATLAPGDDQTFTATYELSQLDLDRMAASAAPATAISNEASADGEPANGPLGAVTPDTADVGVTPDPELTLLKTSSVGVAVNAGDLITYTFVLQNTGNVTISNPTITDAKCQIPASPLTFASGYVSGDTGVIAQSLDVNETWTYSCQYALTQTDIDNGTVQNTATAQGQDPAGNTEQDVSDSGNAADTGAADDDPTNTPIVRAPSWTVVKSTTSTPTAVGDTLTYQFIVTNTGNVSISGVTISDIKCQATPILMAASDTGTPNVISPAGSSGAPAAEQWIYTCTSVGITQAEIDAGRVDNDVVVQGTAPGGNPANAVDDIFTTIPTTPSMSLAKSAGASSLNSNGSFDQVFNFVLKNTGNVTLNSVSITDNIATQFGVCFDSVVSTGAVVLADAAPSSDSSVPSLGIPPVLANSATLSVGDSISLSNYVVRFNPNASGCSFPAPAMNTATANASTVSSGNVSDVSDNGVNPDLGVANSAGQPTPFVPPVVNSELGMAKAVGVPTLNIDGSIDVQYTLLIENTGNVDIRNLVVSDDLVTQFGSAFIASPATTTSGGVLIAPNVTSVLDAGSADLVLPGAVVGYDGSAATNMTDGTGYLGVGDRVSVTFTVRINPIAAGAPANLLNTATVSGVDPSNANTTDNSNSGSDPSADAGGPGAPTEVVPPASTPSLNVIKTVSGLTTFNKAGDTITYQYEVSNTGNITIDTVSPIDVGPMFNGSAATNSLSAVSPASVSLDPTQSQIFTATYVLDLIDVNNMAAAANPLQAITNTANASGDPVGPTALPAVTDSTVMTGFVPTPSLTIDKSVGMATSFNSAGDTITYEYLVENTGNVTINGVVPTDSGPSFNGTPGVNTLSAYSPSSVTITPGNSQLFTATYLLDQDDVDAMASATDPALAIANTASAQGSPVGGTLAAITPDTVQTGFTLTSALILSKTAGVPSIGLGSNLTATDAGDTIAYSFDVMNSGTVTVSGLQVNDLGVTFNSVAGTGSLSSINCPVVSLAPTQSTTCAAMYTLTQSDIDNAVAGGANSIRNEANASGQNPASSAVTSPNDTATTSVTASSDIELTKSAAAPTVNQGSDATIVDPGDTITYTVFVENTGNTSLANINISDTLVALTCPALTTMGNAFANDGTQSLAVGDSVSCSAVYTLLVANLDAGSVSNTASVSSMDPAGAPISGNDTVTSGFTQKAAVSLIKSATALPATPAVGDIITYRFELSNIGNVSLSSPQVSDALCETPVGPLTRTNGYMSGDLGTANEMEVGEAWVFECGYVLTQPNIDAGEISNSATGTGTPPVGSGLTDPTSSASNLADAQQNAALSLIKTAALPTIAGGSVATATDAGDTISYTFEVTNTGNVTLNNVMVTDPLISNAPNNGTITCPVGALASMAPNDIVSCTASYIIQLTDVNTGQVPNTASATGTPPVTVPAITPPTAQSSSVVSINSAPSLNITKSVLPLPVPFAENSVITYQFTVANDGNVSMSNVMPIDTGPTFNGAVAENSLSVFTPLSANLDPGQSQVFEASYTVTQGDIDNMSTAADPATGIDNSASATGMPSRGTLPAVSSSVVATGVILASSLELIKTSMPPVSVPIVEGDLITYNFTLQNTGSLSITNPIVTDAQCATPGSVLSFTSGYVSGDTGIPVGVLEPNELWSFSCTYPITQNDINVGTVQNSATGSGETPSGTTVSDTSDSGNVSDPGAGDDDPTNTALLRAPSWTVAKSTTSTPSNEGDTLVYDFVVDNTGNVSISNIVMTDANCATSIALISGDGNLNTRLDPLETWTYRCTSNGVTQAQVNAGVVVNTVNVVGTPPAGSPVLPPLTDIVNTPIAPAPSLTVDKTAAAPTVGFGTLATVVDAGDQIAYSYEVNNTGNVTLSNITIVDAGPTFNSVAGQGTFSVTSCAATTLIPAQFTTCTATYTLAQTDIDSAIAGGVNSVSNTATAQGTPPVGAVADSVSSTALQTVVSNPELMIVKTAGSPTIANGTDPVLTDPNDTIPFSISVTNTGNTLLNNVSISDNLAVVTCNALATPSNTAFVNGTGSLLVGDSVACQATYSITQDNINSGFVLNTASVTAEDPAGTGVSEMDQATSSFTQKTSLSLLKSSTTLPVVPTAGVSTLTYTFQLKNTGNVSLSATQISDAKCQSPVSPLSFSSGYNSGDDGNGILDASETWVFSCDYVITQADINLGEVTNVATATGTPPAGSGLTAPTSTSSNLADASQTTGITLDKVAGMPTQTNGSNSQEGDTVTYVFTIENTGNVTLTNTDLGDPLITNAPNNGTFSCVRDDVGSTLFTPTTDPLNPAEKIICSAVYTLQQGDIDAGLVGNTAQVTATPPVTVPPTSPPEAMSGSSVPIVPDSQLSIDKTASVIPATVVAGNVITYSYRVENTGNVTISNVTPVDVGPTFNGVAGTNTLSAFDVAPLALAPGDFQVFMATYTISQTDLDNMATSATPATAVSNEATAQGTSATGPAPVVTPDTATTGVAGTPVMALVKTSVVAASVKAGDSVNYTFVLTNTGNVTVTNPLINDARCESPASPLTLGNGYQSGDTGATTGALDVGETWTFRCDYSMTQADIDAGTVQNTATANGQDPAGNPVQDVSDSGNAGDGGAAGDDPTNTVIGRSSSWTVAKSTNSMPTSLGDTLEYQFLITNTGNVSISSVSVIDAKCDTAPALDASSDIGSDMMLSPAGRGGAPAAEQWRYTCISLPITQVELDARRVDNMVMITGAAPGGNPADADDAVSTTVNSNAAMSLSKSAGASVLNPDGTFDQTFNFVLKNTGNVTLNNVSMTDNIVGQFGTCVDSIVAQGVAALVDTAPLADSSVPALAASPTLATSMTLGVADVITLSNYIVRFDPNAAACSFPVSPMNTASSSATTTFSGPVSDVSDNGTDPDSGVPNSTGVPTPFTQPSSSPQIGLAKAASTPTLNADGTIDVIYTLIVQNTGDVDIQNLVLNDDLSTQFGSAYTASTVGDVTNGILTVPLVQELSDANTDNLVLPVGSAAYNGTAGVNMLSSGGYLGVGDQISISFTARFNPNAVGAPTVFLNTATVSGIAPSGSGVNDSSNPGSDPSVSPGGTGAPTQFIPPTMMPSIELLKSGTFNNNGAIDYVFTITNTGNVNVSDIVLSDSLLPGLVLPVALDGDIDGDIDVLAPSQSVMVSASYTPTQTDIAAGEVQNSATVSGRDPGGDSIDDTSDSTDPNDDTGGSSDPTVTELMAPSLGIAKALQAGSPVSLGNGRYQVTYEFVVENSGTFDLNDLQIDDDLNAMINTPNTNNGSFSNTQVSSPNNTLTPNPNYDGSTDIGMLSGTDTLLVGEVGRLELTLTFEPDVYFGPFFNQAQARAQNLGGNNVSDVSESGAIVNPNSASPTTFSIATPSTPITLGWFESQPENGGVRFDWTTEVEVSNAGFYLMYSGGNDEWLDVNPVMVVAKGDSTHVQEYSYVALGLNAVQFKLVDVSVTGKRVEHGPFDLGQSYGVKSQRKVTDWEQYNTESQDKKRLRDKQLREQLQERLRKLKLGQSNLHNESRDVKRQSVFASITSALLSVFIPTAHAIDLASFTVEEAGLFKVTHNELMSQGVDLRGVALDRISLTQAGEQWPRMIAASSGTEFTAQSFIVFPGKGLQSLYTRENKYTLAIDGGTPSNIELDERPIPYSTAPATSFLDEAVYAPQNRYTHLSPSTSDAWYADRLQAITGAVSKRVSIIVDEYAPAVNGPSYGSGGVARMPILRPRLEVNLWGSSDLPGNGVTKPDHHVLVDFNAERVADEYFDGLHEYPIQKVVPNLMAGVNNVTITLPKDHGYQFDLVNLDRVSIFYPRRLHAKDQGNSLVLTSSWNFFKVSALSENKATIIRLDPQNKAHLITTRGQGQCKQGCVYFPGSDANQTDTYYVATDNGLKTPDINVVNAYTNIHDSAAEYLIIAHTDFIGNAGQALENYANSLRDTYSSVDIVSVDDIYSQYSGHVVDAHAISSYIQDAYTERGTRHLMLVGGDIYDYHNNLNTNARSFIPSLYVKIAVNVNAVPSDAKYGDIDGDLVPDITVARLPVRSTQELETILSKRNDYLARSRDKKAVFAADKTDNSGYSFKANSLEVISNHFNGWDVDKVFLDDVSLTAGRRSLLSKMSGGASLISYFGHSSTDRWSISGLLTGDDVTGLSNYNDPYVVTQWGCWNTFYVSPDQDSLAHRFLVDGENGAVTVMGATSFTKADAEKRMANLLFERLSQGMSIADAVLSAKRALAKDYPYQLDVLLGWAVLGPDDMPVTID